MKNTNITAIIAILIILNIIGIMIAFRNYSSYDQEEIQYVVTKEEIYKMTDTLVEVDSTDLDYITMRCAIQKELMNPKNK